jgi:hypothetical protein
MRSENEVKMSVLLKTQQKEIMLRITVKHAITMAYSGILVAISRSRQLAGIVVVVASTGCASSGRLTSISYFPSTETPMKSVCLVRRPMNPERVIVADACGSREAENWQQNVSPLLGFLAGQIALRVEGGDTDRRSSEFANAAPVEPFEFCQIMTTALTERLNSIGYTVSALNVEKKTPAELILKRSQTTTQAETFLDTAVNFVGLDKSDCKKNIWQPVVIVDVRLVSTRDGQVLFHKTIIATATKDIFSTEPDPTYLFNNEREIITDKKRALEGLRVCIARIADQIAVDLNPDSPVLYIYNVPSWASNGGPGNLIVNGTTIARTFGNCVALRLPVGQVYVEAFVDKNKNFTIEAQPGKAYYVRKNVWSVDLVDEKTGLADMSNFKPKPEYLPK